MSALLEILGARKTFGATRALDGADFTVRAGELHGLLGSNGAGKSSMIKVLSGIYTPDAGSMTVRRSDGRPGPGHIGVIHQDLGLVTTLSVRDNFFLGKPGRLRRLGFVDSRAETEAATRALALVGLEIDIERPIDDFDLGARSLIAVAVLLSKDSDVLILDEVTAALTRSESDRVLGSMRDLADSGRAVVLVSHRLHEVTERCDHVTVLADGRTVFEGPTPELAELHDLLSGGQELSRTRSPSVVGEPVLTLRGASADGVGPVDLEVRAGEVVGIVGPLASGLYSIGHLAAGQLPLTGGTRATTAKGAGKVGFLPEDRKLQAILPGLSVATNMTISALPSLSRAGLWMDDKRERATVDDFVHRLDVRPADPSLALETLSGGNQQKVLLARTAALQPSLFVLCEPTRGVDLATRHAIYRHVDALREEGAAVLVVSIDVDDILAICDRVTIADAGRLSPLVAATTYDPSHLLELVS